MELEEPNINEEFLTYVASLVFLLNIARFLIGKRLESSFSCAHNQTNLFQYVSVRL
jgi:hypothetical protein